MDEMVKRLRILYKKYRLLYVLLILQHFLLMCSNRQDQFVFVIPWDDSSDSITNLSYLIPKPAGRDGFVFVKDDGHLYTKGGRIRFWGVNMSFGACFPDKNDAGVIAKHLAKYGVNIVRFHHIDMKASPDGIWKTINPDREIDKVQLDKLDYFIYQLKENGIYTDLNLLVSRPFNPGEGLNENIAKIYTKVSERMTFNSRKTLLFFDDEINKLQNAYVEELLTHVNPYTGTNYADEPSIAFVEVLNECGLIQSYLSGYLNELPEYYGDILGKKWNKWLLDKYTKTDKIIEKWDIKNFTNSVNTIKGSEFSEWNLRFWEVNGDEKEVAVELAKETAPGRHSPLKFTVKAVNKPVLLLGRRDFIFKPGEAYKITFYIKTTKNRYIRLLLKEAGTHEILVDRLISLRSNWVKLGTKILHFDKEVFAELSIYDESAAPGDVLIANLTCNRAVPADDPRLYVIEEERIKILDAFKRSWISFQGEADWFSFLLSLEEKYWKRAISFLKKDIGIHYPIIGTRASVTTPTITTYMDIISDNQYWIHPLFTSAREWDPVYWFVPNDAMINYPKKSMIGQLASKKLYKKPFVVAEYNHPHPMTFQAEAFFILSAYAGLQDWDGIIIYAYSQEREEWGSESIRNYFDIGQNPVKLASFFPAALSFLRGDIRPALKKVVVPVDREKELHIIPLTAMVWKILDAESAGLNPLTALIHRVVINTGKEKIDDPDTVNKKTFTNEKNTYESDTRELLWDHSKIKRGVLRVNAERVKYLVGFTDGVYDFSGILIEPGERLQNGFCAISLSVINDDSFETASTIVITALGLVDNKESVWYEYPDKAVQFPPEGDLQITLQDKWGKFPTYVEGIRAEISIPLKNRKEVSVWALDSRGKRSGGVPVTVKNNYAIIKIGPRYKAVWYEVAIK
jgi:hypothetical protein